jgi:hypothetical protein
MTLQSCLTIKLMSELFLTRCSCHNENQVLVCRRASLLLQLAGELDRKNKHNPTNIFE